MTSSIKPMGPGHSHGHSHDEGFIGDWGPWRQDRTLKSVLVIIAIAALATVAGVVALWPTGEGQQIAGENADEIGLVTERLSGTIEDVIDGPCSYSTAESPQNCREVTLIVHEGPEAGALVILPEFNTSFDPSVPDLSSGDQIVVGYEESTNFYFYADRDRRASLVWLVGLFALVVIALGRVRGLLALIAMAATVFILVFFVAPSVLDGNNPLLVALVAASAIAFISLYLTHGFSPTTTVALVGTLGALALTLGLSWIFFELANFTGLASEEAVVLPFIAADVDLGALLLGGAVIGALGALDDVTVTQVATVAELRFRSPHLSRRELVASGIRVGREHIASTVNTLLLAYAGASMSLLLLFAASDQSLGLVANSELVAVEIVRTLCGSIGLVAAVPITTALAATVIAGPRGSFTESPPERVATAPSSSAVASSAVATSDAVSANTPESAMPHQDMTEPEPAPSWDDFSPRDDPPSF